MVKRQQGLIVFLPIGLRVLPFSSQKNVFIVKRQKVLIGFCQYGLVFHPS